MRAQGEVTTRDALGYVAVQMIAAIAGVWLAHAMFDLPILQLGVKIRTEHGQWISEAVATAGLILTILGTRKTTTVATSVALYITTAYWFTASTSFANPAVTVARSLTASFAGIVPRDAPMVIISHIMGAGLAALVAGRLFRQTATE